MSAATIVSIILAIIKLANNLFGYLHDRGIINAEQDRLIAAALVEMKNRSTTLKEIDAQFAKMTDKDVYNEIDKHNDFRD